ncbi:MAG: HD domain-containing protein [Planctomycetota bacterium]|nr:MAG: HD domain-containing protein [Planctomycetota bacterium]
MKERTLTSSQQQIVQMVAQIVAERMTGQQAGHGLDHVRRVVGLARYIHQREGRGSRLIIELAAWVHDVGDAKLHDGTERSEELVDDILQRAGVDRTTSAAIMHIVQNMSFRHRAIAQPLSIEGQIVQDADRLDALGAIGIVRTVEYGAARGQPFHVFPGESDGGPTGRQHFFDKLLHLVQSMHTETARELGAQREQFMRSFLAQFDQEWSFGQSAWGQRS